MARYFNSNIKFLRKSKNISQDEIACKTGIDRSLISRIENNKIETSMETAMQLSKFFRINLETLITKDLTKDNVNEITSKEFEDEVKILLSKTNIDEKKKDTLVNVLDMICEDKYGI